MAKIVIVAGGKRSLVNFRGDLIKEWLSLGHEVVAAAPGKYVNEKFASLGVRCYSIDFSRTGLNPIKDFSYFFRLIQLLKNEKPNILFLYNIKPVIYGSIAAFFYRNTAVYSMITGLGYVFGKGYTFKQRVVKSLAVLFYRLALKRNTRVFFQNPDDLQLFKSYGLIKSGKEVLINGSGINLERFKPAQPVVEPVTFLLIARLLWDKGIGEYVDAARRIRNDNPKVRFLLVGSYYEAGSAVSKAHVESWVSEGVIEYLGHVDDVRPVIANSSIYVLPSYYREGVPRTILEAMAMGKPVITTDSPGCKETVEDNLNGFLVPVKDSNSLVESMKYFIDNPSMIKKMGAESRKLVEKKFDVKVVNRVINEAMELK